VFDGRAGHILAGKGTGIVAVVGKRRRPERSRRRTLLVAAALGVLSLFWLAALSEPGSGEGVVILELLTALPLGLVLLHLRRQGPRLEEARKAEPDVEGPSRLPDRRFLGGRNRHSSGPTCGPPPELEFDASMPPDLVLRTRSVLLLLAMVAALGLPAFGLKLSYDMALFDIRIATVAVYGVLLAVAAVRARI